MSMNQETIIQEIEAEVAHQEDIAQTATARVEQLKAALAALRGQPTVESPKPDSIAELIAATARQLDKETPGCVFDHRTLVTGAAELHPTEYSRIKNGIYAAVTTLKRQGVLKLAPDGFQISH